MVNRDCDANELSVKGIGLLRAGNSLGTLACFERAYSIIKTPALKSCLGLCIATERGSISEAIVMCHEAIKEDPENPLHYVNLGKIYLKCGRKGDCLDVLRRGLFYGNAPEICELLDSIGTRKPPVFTFLSRGHFLNRYAGLCLRMLRMR